MARRVAINLSQRTANNNARGRGRGGRGAKIHSASVIPNNDTILEKVPSTAAETTNTNQVDPQKDQNATSKPETASKPTSTKTELKQSPVQTEKSDPLIEETTIGSTTNERGRKRTITEVEMDDVNTIFVDLKNVMGFESFNSTKNKQVKGTDCYGIKFKQKTEYRQYMNREGGFNRELSPTRIEKKKIKLSLKKDDSNKKQKLT